MARRALKDSTKGFSMTCNKCNKKLELKDFYSNASNRSFYFKDCWCRDCTRKYVKDTKTMQEYCYFNNRMFRPELWEEAQRNVEILLTNDEKYKSFKDVDKMKDYENQKTINYYYSKMNLSQWYKFIDNTLKEEIIIELEEEKKLNKKMSKLKEEIEEQEKEYNHEWHGYYTKNELEYLNNYFVGLQNDFDISNMNYVDYAKKVAKASLIMDMAFSDLMDGVAGAEKRYKEAKEIFDSLSQSAKFSAKTRTANDNSGFGSLGELIKIMESSGFMQKKVKFAKDDVDKIIEDFRWTLASIGDDVSG